MPETELLQIVVQEELERCRAAGKHFFVPAVYRRRRILTAIAICVNFLVLILWYSHPATVTWCLLLALLYVWLHHRWEPVKILCAEVKKQLRADFRPAQMRQLLSYDPRPRKLAYTLGHERILREP